MNKQERRSKGEKTIKENVRAREKVKITIYFFSAKKFHRILQQPPIVFNLMSF